MLDEWRGLARWALWSVAVVACGAVAGCGLADSDGAWVLEPFSEVVLRGLHQPSAVQISADGLIYAADPADSCIKVYGPGGRLVRRIGMPGEAPGQFRRPEALALGDGFFVVSDLNGRISFFEVSGELRSSFLLPEIVPFTSSLAVLGPNKLLVGGFQGDRYEGDLLHLFSFAGERLHSFSFLAQAAIEHQAFAVTGSFFDLSSVGSIFAVQPTEYVIRRFASPGRRLPSLAVQSASYRPLRQDQPDDEEGRKLDGWLASFDHVKRVFVVHDELLAVDLWLSNERRHRTELIHRSSGRVVASWISSETLIAADPTRHRLHFVRSGGEGTVLSTRVVVRR